MLAISDLSRANHSPECGYLACHAQPMTLTYQAWQKLFLMENTHQNISKGNICATSNFQMTNLNNGEASFDPAKM